MLDRGARWQWRRVENILRDIIRLVPLQHTLPEVRTPPGGVRKITRVVVEVRILRGLRKDWRVVFWREFVHVLVRLDSFVEGLSKEGSEVVWETAVKGLYRRLGFVMDQSLVCGIRGGFNMLGEQVAVRAGWKCIYTTSNVLQVIYYGLHVDRHSW